MDQKLDPKSMANERESLKSAANPLPKQARREGVTQVPIDDKTVLLTGAKQPDEMQVIWSKSEVVRAISGKTKIIPPDKVYSLKVTEGADRGKVFPLEKKERFCIGRSGGDLVIKDPKISKVHCVIEFYEGIVVIKDMNSTNGTLLNQMVLAEDFIKDGDRLQVGNTTFLFQGNK